MRRRYLRAGDPDHATTAAPCTPTTACPAGQESGPPRRLRRHDRLRRLHGPRELPRHRCLCRTLRVRRRLSWITDQTLEWEGETVIVRAGSQVLYPAGGAQGAGCQADGWRFVGVANIGGVDVTLDIGFDASFVVATQATGGVRAQTAPSYVLEITEFSDWEVPGQPPPQVPANVKVTPQGGTAVGIEGEGGAEGEAAIAPPLEVPFTTITKYEVGDGDADGSTGLPDTGVGPGTGDGGGAGLLIGLGALAAGAAVAARRLRQTSDPDLEPKPAAE